MYRNAYGNPWQSVAMLYIKTQNIQKAQIGSSE